MSFEAEFADRFRGGELVEHTGWTPRGSYGNWGTTERAEPAERPELRRTPIPRTRVNKSTKKGREHPSKDMPLGI